MGLAGNYTMAGKHPPRVGALAKNDSRSALKLTSRSLSFPLNYVQHGRAAIDLARVGRRGLPANDVLFTSAELVAANHRAYWLTAYKTRLQPPPARQSRPDGIHAGRSRYLRKFDRQNLLPVR
jgi:hypothetical protein